MTNQINNQSIIPSTDVIQLTLTLKMTTAQVVEKSVTVNNNSPIQDYVHPDDQTQPFEMIPGFKPFTVMLLLIGVSNCLILLYLIQAISCIIFSLPRTIVIITLEDNATLRIQSCVPSIFLAHFCHLCAGVSSLFFV